MDEPETDLETDAPEKDARSPRYLLVIATLMIFVAIAAYTFEEDLYDVFYSSKLFVYSLTISVIVALGCLFAYSNALLKGSRRMVIRRSQSSGGVTYNVFGGQTVGDVKASHGLRKSARHLRKKLARDTPSPKSEKSDDNAKDEDKA